MTSPTPAIAPYVPTYANRVPYLTRAEFLAAPTGVDSSQLIPGGSTSANGAALDTLLLSASSFADQICHQVLAATADLQTGVYRRRPDGTIRVPVDFTPLIEVTGVSVGSRPGQLSALTDLSGLWIERKVVRIPVPNIARSGGDVFAQVAYVNGYANTTLTAAAIVGATSVLVASALGIFPGLTLTLLADAAATTEQVTVASSYVQGSTTVPLVAALTHAHGIGDALTAMPRAAKQATICLATHLVKTRGAESVAMASTMTGTSAGAKKKQKDEVGSTAEYEQACQLLSDFMRTR